MSKSRGSLSIPPGLECTCDGGPGELELAAGGAAGFGGAWGGSLGCDKLFAKH